MPIELAGIKLERIHRITTLEESGFVTHKVPGLEGNIVQDMGRNSVRLEIRGIFYGETAGDSLESLRNLYKTRQPVDFLADVVGQSYFGQVVLESFHVFQLAEDPGQYSYTLTIAEYVEPPEPVGTGIADVDAEIQAEALDFMAIAGLPDLLSVPDFGDPTVPLNTVLDGIEGVFDSFSSQAELLKDFFKEE